MPRKIGIGILGYGRFADKWLRRAIPNSRHASLAAVQCRSRLPDLPGVSVYSDIDQLLEDRRVDAVYVTSPNAYHEEHARRALEAGKHVLCEKPMAVTPSQARRMIAAARRFHRYLAVGHMLRFSPALKRAKALLEKKALGQLLYARAAFSYRLAKEMRSWAHDKKIAGGGVLLDGGIHCIDSLRFLLESPRLSARACVLKSSAGARVETSATCILESSAGCVVEVSAHSNAPYDSCLEVTGSRGRLTLEGFARCAGEVTLEFHPEGSGHLSMKVIEVGGVHEGQIDAFCEMATNDPGNTQNAQDGLRNVEIVHALYAAS